MISSRVMTSHQIVCDSPSLAAPLELLAHCQNVASLSFSIVISLIDVHLNRINWFYLLILAAPPLVVLIGCMIFLTPFLDVIRMSMSTVSFSRTPRFWYSLHAECFPLTYDLNSFKSRVNRHLFNRHLSKKISSTIFIFFFFFCNAIPCRGCSALHEWKPN